MKRYAWLSDTHMNLSVLPFLKRLHLLGAGAVELGSSHVGLLLLDEG